MISNRKFSFPEDESEECFDRAVKTLLKADFRNTLVRRPAIQSFPEEMEKELVAYRRADIEELERIKELCRREPADPQRDELLFIAPFPVNDTLNAFGDYKYLCHKLVRRSRPEGEKEKKWFLYGRGGEKELTKEEVLVALTSFFIKGSRREMISETAVDE